MFFLSIVIVMDFQLKKAVDTMFDKACTYGFVSQNTH